MVGLECIHCYTCIKKIIFLKKNGTEQDINVFRVAKTGQIDETTFMSTYAEIAGGYIENKDIDEATEEELNNIGFYGTSCDMTLQKAKKSLKLFMRHYPNPIILQGKVKCGLSQHSFDRTHQRKDKNHLDWWRYNCCKDEFLEFSNFSEE